MAPENLADGISGSVWESARGEGQTFEMNWPSCVAQTSNYLIVVFLMRRFTYEAVLRILEARRQRMAESLENAEKIKKELAETESARKEILDKANQEANRMIEEAKEAAARVKEEETQKAITQAERIVAQAKEAREVDQARMMTELKQEIGRLVVETTEKVVGKTLTNEDQKRLAEEANRQLAA
jgi:F-type H+-transporting ATPase subunit b